MKYLFGLGVILIIIALIFPTDASITETTEFFSKEAKTVLYYQTYSGYEDIDWYYPKGSASMYYSLWQQIYSEWSDKDVPLIIWLQGGPGAPSQFGCFNEIGPIYLEGKKGNFMPNENVWSWNYYAHILCIDQPLGVGFSFNNNSQKINNTGDAASHLINFLTNFFDHNPKFSLKQNPLYIAGQSYAGHYIPAFANKIISNSSLGFNLKGILIGDGLVDPLNQFNNYDSFLNAAGIVSNSWRDTVSFMQNEAITRIMEGNYKQASDYTNFIIDDENIVNKYYFGMSVMNYKLYDEGNINTDYAFYLEQKKKSFGVPDWLKYVDDNQQMYKDFGDDISRSFKNQLERVIEADVNVLIYNGQNDMIINTPGVLTYLNTLQWKYSKQWKASPKKVWRVGNQKPIVGWSKKYRNLNFVLVRNAGHLVPADQPRSAFNMLERYLLNRW